MANFIYKRNNVSFSWSEYEGSGYLETVSNVSNWILAQYPIENNQIWVEKGKLNRRTPVPTDISPPHYYIDGGSQYNLNSYSFTEIGAAITYQGEGYFTDFDTVWWVDGYRFLRGTVQGETGTHHLVLAEASLQPARQTTLYKHYKIGTKLPDIVGTENQYPINGASGNIWYVRTSQLAESATITNPSGGDSIDSNFNITWTKTAADTNTDIELSFDNGTTWKRIVSNVTGTSLNYNFENEQETSTARLRTRAVKGSASGEWAINDGVFTIQHDYAPLAPSNLSPNNTIVSRLYVVQLAWNHNHPNPQSKFDLRWSTNQQTWNTVTRSATNQYYNAPESLFPAGEIYWQVRAYSDAGIVSAWSNVAKFTAAIPSDAPTILSSPTTSIARPTFQWSQADQVAYQIIILDSVNNEVWNTGEVTSSNKAVTSGIDLLNHSTYKFRIRTKTELGLWTQYSEQIITVSYTPPARPTVSVDMIDTGVRFNINNPEPTGTEPFHSHNDLYKLIDDKWIRIAKELQETYTDYSLASEEVAVYRVRSVSADNDTFGESEVIEVTGNKLKGIWIYDVDNPDSLVNFKIDGGGRNESREVEHSFFKFAGRRKPVVQFGTQEDFAISANVAILRDDELKKKLDNLISKTVLYRDGRGRKVYGSIPHLTYNEIRSIGYEVAINVIEIDYAEEV